MVTDRDLATLFAQAEELDSQQIRQLLHQTQELRNWARKVCELVDSAKETNVWPH